LGFWPARIAQEHPRCCVWTLQYTARLFEWNPFARGRSIDLLDRAVWLVQSLVQNKIPAKPIVFVTHSLGGVLVKQALQFARSLGPAEWRTVWGQTQAVVFLATPHVGSHLADVATLVAEVTRGASMLTRLVLRPSPALKNLEKNNPTLRYLSDWYRDQAPTQGIETIAFAERRPYKGVMVVDESSANPQVANCVVVPLPDDDHVSIAKPTHREHLVYGRVSGLLGDLEKRASAALASPIPVAPRPDRITITRQAENKRLIGLLCGDWWERITLEGVSAISFLQINWDPLFNSVFLGGKSYNSDGAHRATWRSLIARVDKEGNKLRLQYVWKGEHIKGELANVPFHGFGSMEFDEPSDPGEEVCSGTGKFWEVDEFHPAQTILKPTELRRVRDDSAARTINKGTKKEIKELIEGTLDPDNW
jgi:hypothetical protein